MNRFRKGMAIALLVLTFVAAALSHDDCEHGDGLAHAPSTCVCVCHATVIPAPGANGISYARPVTCQTMPEHPFMDRLGADDIYRPPIFR